MNTIYLEKLVGQFAENKDLARNIRMEQINPFLDRGEKVTLDFSGVESTTQSFIHALISELFRKYGNEVLESVEFKNCNETIQKIIGIVADYMQQS